MTIVALGDAKVIVPLGTCSCVGVGVPRVGCSSPGRGYEEEVLVHSWVGRVGSSRVLVLVIVAVW